MEPIEFREIEMVLAVARERSFTRAAERRFVSQPALSKTVRKVERALGTAIFDRSSSPLRMTEPGERILDYFRRLTDLQGELASYCAGLRRRRGNEVTIGGASFFCTYVLPPAIAAWQPEHPSFAARLIETNEAELRDLLTAGVLDLGLTVEHDLPPGLTSEVLGEEEIILAAPRDCAVNSRLRNSPLTRRSCAR